MKSAIAMLELMGLHNLSTLTADRSIFDNVVISCSSYRAKVLIYRKHSINFYDLERQMDMIWLRFDSPYIILNSG